MIKYEDIRRLHLNQLRTAMQVRLLKVVHWTDGEGRPNTAPEAPASSPFYFSINQTEQIVTSKTTASLFDAVSEMQAADDVAAERGHGELRNVAPGVRVQLFLPEQLFSHLYQDLEPQQTYIAFRNEGYLQIASRVQAHMPAILSQLGTLAAPVPQNDFSSLAAYNQGRERQAEPGIGVQIGRVGLLGQKMDTQGIIGLELDLPQMCVVNENALRLVRDAVWVMLALDEAAAFTSGLVATLQADGVADDYLDWRLDEPNTANENAILPGFADQSRHVQLLLRAGLLAGADLSLDLRDAGLFTLANGNDQLRLAGRELPLNDVVATRYAENVTARKMVLGRDKLPVPAGSHYTQRTEALTDFQKSFRDKSLVVKGRTPGTTMAYPVPPTIEMFKSAIDQQLATGSVDVEMFVPGDQFSLLVLDGQVLAVSQRDFAYVVGDGRRSLRALIQARDADRRRIGLPSMTEKDILPTDLTDQGVALETVVARGTQVYLGRNSRAAAAGMSQNGRNMLDESYDQLAIAATDALELRLSSVQLRVVNGYVPYDAEEVAHGVALATIVDVDANPDLSIFARPTYGDGVDAVSRVLEACW